MGMPSHKDSKRYKNVEKQNGIIEYKKVMFALTGWLDNGIIVDRTEK